MAYQLPELAEPEAPEKNEVVLIANGDLRLSANQMCWPAQEAMKKPSSPQSSAKDGQSAADTPTNKTRNTALSDRKKKAWPSSKISIPTPPHRRRSRLAIQPPRTPRPDLTPRPHPHPCQLVWAVARPRRHAQPQRLPHQSRSRIQHPLEPGLYRRLLQTRPARMAHQRQRHPRHLPCTRRQHLPPARSRNATRTGTRRTTPARKSHYGRL